MKKQRYVVYYQGQVQGVGFRYTACRVSSRFAVTGFVRNLSDGRVQIVAEGGPEELERFLGAVREEMAGFIRGDDIQREEATGEFTQFGLGW